MGKEALISNNSTNITTSKIEPQNNSSPTHEKLKGLITKEIANNQKQSSVIDAILKFKKIDEKNFINEFNDGNYSAKTHTSNNFFPQPKKTVLQIQQEAPVKTQSTQIRREDVKPGDIIISVGSVDQKFSKEYLEQAFDEYQEGAYERLAPLGSNLTLAQRLISNSTGHNDSVHAGVCVGFDNEGSSYELVEEDEDNLLIPGKLFISIDKSNDFFDYFLIDSKGEKIEGQIFTSDLTTLKLEPPFNIEDLRTVKTEILAITLQRGHTDCKTPIIRDLHGRVQDMSIYKYYIPTTLRVFRPNLPSLLFEKATKNILDTQTETLQTNWENRHLCSLLKVSKLPDAQDRPKHAHYILIKNDKEQRFSYHNPLQDKDVNFELNKKQFTELEESLINIESGEQLGYYGFYMINSITSHSHLKLVQNDRFYMPGRYASKWDDSAKHVLQIGLTPSNFFAPAKMDDLKTEQQTICSKLVIQSYKILLTHIARTLEIEDEHAFVRNYMNLMDNTLPKTLEGYLSDNVNYVELIISTAPNLFDRIGEILKGYEADKHQALYDKVKASSDDQYDKSANFVDEANKLGLIMPTELNNFLITQAVRIVAKNPKGSHHNLTEQYENGQELFETMLDSEILDNSPELAKVKAQIEQQANQYSELSQLHESQKGFIDRNLGCEATTLAKTALVTAGICYLASGF